MVGPLPISSRAVTTVETNDAYNPAIVFVEFLNRCSGANLDMETCLVSSTVMAFMDMENGPERKLQTVEEGCGGPDIDEQGLRLVMDGTKTQCIQSGVSISNEEFETTVAGFMTIFQSDCFCADNAESRLILMEITLDTAADCAQVDLYMPQCLKDHVVLTLSSVTANPGMDSATTDGGIQRKLQDLAVSSTCDHSTLLAGLAMYAATVLEEGKAECAALDVTIGADQLIQAHSALVSIFSAQQCWGMTSDTGCEEGKSDDELGDISGGLDGIGIAIRYIEQCAGFEMNTDSCLTSSSMSAIFPAAFSQSQPVRGRSLQVSEGEADCIPPDLNELTLRYIVGQSALQCSSKGLDSSEQEVEQTVNILTDFFGAQECWVALCEEQAHPSADMYKLIFEEIAQCAGAHFNWNPCLLDQIFALLVSSGTQNDSLERVRRNLQGTFEPCTNESNEAEFTFVVNMLLAGAEQKCLELGEMVAPGDVAEAQTELLKLFTSQQCWGMQIDCAVPENDYRSAYLTFVEERINMVLSECVGAETSTCVFNRSIEVMNGMKLLGWSLDGRSDLFQQIATDPSALCVAPSITEDEVDEIAKYAQAFCVSSGTPMLDFDEYDGAIKNLNSVVTESTCWDELCQSAIKDFILKEWMDHCTSLNLKFLFNQVKSNTDLDTDMVECMVSYILSKEEEINASVICEHPHGECGMDIGEEAFLHCGGNINFPTTTTSPPIQFSMNFGIDDWFPSGQNEQEVGAYVNEACSVIEYLHSSMTMSCLQPVCDGLWIEDTLTVAGSIGVDDDGTDGKTTIVEAPTGTSPLNQQPTRQPTRNPSSKPTPNLSSKPTPLPAKTNDSPSSGCEAALYLAGVVAFTSLIVI